MSRTVSSAARVLRVLKALKGHTVTGLRTVRAISPAPCKPSLRKASR
jgi:hypothetical protein